MPATISWRNCRRKWRNVVACPGSTLVTSSPDSQKASDSYTNCCTWICLVCIFWIIWRRYYEQDMFGIRFGLPKSQGRSLRTVSFPAYNCTLPIHSFVLTFWINFVKSPIAGGKFFPTVTNLHANANSTYFVWKFASTHQRFKKIATVWAFNSQQNCEIVFWPHRQQADGTAEWKDWRAGFAAVLGRQQQPDRRAAQQPTLPVPPGNPSRQVRPKLF